MGSSGASGSQLTKISCYELNEISRSSQRKLCLVTPTMHGDGMEGVSFLVEKFCKLMPLPGGLRAGKHDFLYSFGHFFVISSKTIFCLRYLKSNLVSIRILKCVLACVLRGFMKTLYRRDLQSSYTEMPS